MIRVELSERNAICAESAPEGRGLQSYWNEREKKDTTRRAVLRAQGGTESNRVFFPLVQLDTKFRV